MSRHTLISLPLVIMALAGCQTAYETAATEVGTAMIRDRQGAQIGTARMFSLGGEVTINASFTGLTQGEHGVHLHTTGDCSASDFTSAGGHLNPGNAQHGLRNPQGAHLGDLPNVTIASDGSGTMSTILRGTLSSVEDNVFDADGTAIVVHEKADDNRTDPAGAAGSRVACGILTRS